MAQADIADAALLDEQLRILAPPVAEHPRRLLATALDARQREYAETVQVSGDALLAILNDILDLSKVEAGHLVLESVDFDVAAVKVGDIVHTGTPHQEQTVLDVAESLGGTYPLVVLPTAERTELGGR